MKNNKLCIFICAVFLSVSILAVPALATNSGDFTVTNGVLTKYTGNEKNLVIPDNIGITSIGDYSFKQNNTLTSVTLPNGLISIGERAFADCEGLKSANIPDTVTSIGNYAFSDCHSLSSVILPDSITAMGDGVFHGTILSKPIIVNSGKILGYVPADYTEYVIPGTVTEIAGEAFGPFSQISSITIPQGVTSIGDGAFCICNWLTSVLIPKSVTQIGAGVFSRDSRLVSVNIPDGIKTIGDYTFTDCCSLASIVLPDSVTSIGEIAFSCCNLTSVSLSKNLISIGSNAFYGNARLMSLIIPKSVISIGEGAFAGQQNMMLYGEEGSYAQQYAKANNITFKSIIIAEPVQYTVTVNAKSESLWAYNIDGGVYFKLRDVALLLNGTDKQFEAFWAADSNQVGLSTGNAYSQVGCELNAPQKLQIDAAQTSTDSLYIDALPAAGSVYTANNNNYMTLSDLAATLKLASSLNKENHTAKLISAPESSAAELTGKVIDNIAPANAGSSHSLSGDGSVILSYSKGAASICAPLKLNTSGIYTKGMEESQTGFYISEAKTAIAYGGDGKAVDVLVSDDMGKTWNTYTVTGSSNMCGTKFISFDTVNNGWLTVNPGVALGTSYNYVFATHDGGKTWTQIGNPNYIYPRVTTGLGFVNNQIGFLCFRYDFADFEPAICWTQDGGLTWEKLRITLPEEFDDYNKTPLSPLFSGANGRFPIQLSKSDGNTSTIYLISSDYGKTWVYQEK